MERETQVGTSHDRYPGARSFGDTALDRELFRGRRRDAYDLLQFVLAHPLVLLFARSGHGKSSIINAGLMQPLREHGYFPMVLRVAGGDGKPLRSLYDGVEAACQKAMAAGEIDAYEPAARDEWNTTSLWHFIKTFYVWRDDRALQPVLIFDQFEELFRLVKEADRKAFIDQLADLVRGTRPRPVPGSPPIDDGLTDRPPEVKVVLSIREDFLAHLEELAARIPTILKTRFRLAPLGSGEAKAAIVEPAAVHIESLSTSPFTWSEDALSCVQELLRSRTADDGLDEVPADTVQPFRLQLICQHVERLVREKGLTTVTADDFGGQRGLEEVESRFYTDAITALCRQFPGRNVRRHLEMLCEEELITGGGARRILDEETITERGVSADMLAEMVNRRLLRTEARRGVKYYELSHDGLIRPIREARSARRQRRRRLQKKVVGGVVVVSLVTVAVASVWLYLYRRQDWARDTLARLEQGEAMSIQAAGKLSVGDTTDGTLGSTVYDSAILQAWDLELERSRTLQVSLGSEDFDARLMVRTPSGQVLGDDDSGVGLNSEVSFTGGPGPLRVIVTSFGGRDTGDYRLRVDERLEIADVLVPDDVPRWRGLVVDGEVTGRLTDRSDGVPLDVWEVAFPEPEPVRLLAESDDFELLIGVETTAGQHTAHVPMGGREAELTFTAGPGTVPVFVSSVSGRETGDYRVILERSIVQSNWAVLDSLGPASTDRRLVVGEPATGELRPEDDFQRAVLHAWDLVLDRQQPLRLSMSSRDFDTYLVVETTTGEVLTDDDGGSGTDSQLQFTTGPGRVRVVATSFDRTSTGMYRIELEDESAAGARPDGGVR